MGGGAGGAAATATVAAASQLLCRSSEYMSSAEVQERGVTALCNIASVGDEVLATRMVEAGVVETIKKGLAAHMSHAELWACGQATLVFTGSGVH